MLFERHNWYIGQQKKMMFGASTSAKLKENIAWDFSKKVTRNDGEKKDVRKRTKKVRI